MQLDTPLTPKSRRTRAALVRAAMEIIGRDGVQAVSVVTACAEAGVGRTSFYNYFPDTQALIRTVAEDTGNLMRQRFEALHGQTDRGLARLETCLRLVLEIMAVDQNLGRLITALARSDPRLTAMLQHEISREIEGARKTGELALDQVGASGLCRFLTITTLALGREFAFGRLLKEEVPAQVSHMLRALPRA